MVIIGDALQVIYFHLVVQYGIDIPTINLILPDSISHNRSHLFLYKVVTAMDYADLRETIKSNLSQILDEGMFLIEDLVLNRSQYSILKIKVVSRTIAPLFMDSP